MATFTQEQIQLALESRLEKWQTGQMDWNVSNQFEKTTIESALECLNEETTKKVNERFALAPEDGFITLEIVYFLSSFEAPEIDSAWID